MLSNETQANDLVLTVSLASICSGFLFAACLLVFAVAAILELNEHRNASFKIFEAAPQNERGVPQKKPAPDYFL
jgi:hypothetical protein